MNVARELEARKHRRGIVLVEGKPGYATTFDKYSAILVHKPASATGMHCDSGS